jgi:hypothetical protein
MSEKTMLDLNANIVLEGDPLGLRAIEDSLTWRSTGNLPDWLDEDPFDDNQMSSDDSPSGEENRPASGNADSNQASAVRPERDTFAVLDLPDSPPAVAIQSPAPAVTAPSLVKPPEDDSRLTRPPSDAAGNDLVSINDILRFVDEAPASKPVIFEAPAAAVAPPAPVSAPPHPAPPVAPPVVSRRAVTFEDLLDARLCLLAGVADRLWAVPLDRIVAVTSTPKGSKALDLHLRQEGKKRRGATMSIVLDTDMALVVDRVLGPRSFAWEALPAKCDAPTWELARAIVGGEAVGLLDWQALAD